jgi:hypothetical protein
MVVETPMARRRVFRGFTEEGEPVWLSHTATGFTSFDTWDEAMGHATASPVKRRWFRRKT